jgi:ribosome maturation protein SDO1
MVNLEDAVIARYKREGKNFEILVDGDKALLFKEGKDVLIDELVVTIDVFSDIKKGLHVSEDDLIKMFGTKNKEEVCKKIIKEGEVQITAEQQKRFREEKLKQIINLIHRNSVDPKTGLPHPPQRIENAINEKKVSIDPFKPAETQVDKVVGVLRELLPLKFEIREIEIKIPAKYSGRCFGLFKQYGKILKEEWQSDGSLVVVLEIPGGLQEELFNQLNSLTSGSVESKILKTR